MLKQPEQRLRVAMVGKYVDLTESYKSLNESLAHGGVAHGVGIDIEYVDSEKLEGTDLSALWHGAHGILVPHGFGSRAAPRARCRRSASPARTRCRISASATACNAPSSKPRADLADLPGANSIEIDPEDPARR